MPPEERCTASADEILAHRKRQNTLAQRRRRERLKRELKAGKEQQVVDAKGSDGALLCTPGSSANSAASQDFSSGFLDSLLLEWPLSAEDLGSDDLTSLDSVQSTLSYLEAPRLSSAQSDKERLGSTSGQADALALSSCNFVEVPNELSKRTMLHSLAPLQVKSLALYQQMLALTSSTASLLTTTRISLPSLVAMEAYRSNYLRLGLTPSLMETHNTQSPIARSWAIHELGTASDTAPHDAEGKSMTATLTSDDSEALRWDRVPANMHPTRLQLILPHHPFFDVSFPWPAVRDRLLAQIAKGSLSEQEFCADCLQHPLSTGTPQSFMIWGADPMDEDNWELEERFALKYQALFDDAVIKRTNWWRKKRDLPPIR